MRVSLPGRGNTCEAIQLRCGPRGAHRFADGNAIGRLAIQRPTWQPKVTNSSQSYTKTPRRPLDPPDATPVLDWIRDLIAGRFESVVLMTGEAVRRMLGLAEREGLRDALVAALGRTPSLTRGPKPALPLKDIGIVPTKFPLESKAFIPLRS